MKILESEANSRSLIRRRTPLRAASILTLIPILGALEAGRAEPVTITNPAAASGMSQSGVKDPQQQELMKVRIEAQQARSAAEQAALERSVNEALENQHRQKIINEQREKRELMRQLAERAKYQKETAPNAFQGVGQSQVQSWSSQGQDKVERGVPPQFTSSLPVEEEAGKEDKGGALGTVKNVLSWRPNITLPFIGRDKEEEAAARINKPDPLPAFAPAESLALGTAPPAVVPAVQTGKEGGGFRLPDVSKLIPKIDWGGKDKASEPAPEQVNVPINQMAQQQGPAPGSSGRAPVQLNVSEPPAPAPQSSDQPESLPMLPPAPQLAEQELPSADEGDEGKGFFKGLATMVPFVGGNDNSSVEEPSDGGSLASAELFGPVSEGDAMPAYSSSSSQSEPESGGDKPGFFAKMKDRLSFGSGGEEEPQLPDFTSLASSGDQSAAAADAPPQPKVESRTISASNPNPEKLEIYVVESSEAEFFKFGGESVESGGARLPQGIFVRMSKKGEEWSSVELTDGTVGIMRNKALRPAKQSEVPASMFARHKEPSYPTTARITETRSATNRSSISPRESSTPVPPMDVPLPEDGPELGTLPIGDGLLPPLDEGAIQ